MEGIKTVENNTESFENSSHNNSKNNLFLDHNSCLEHSSNSPENYHTIINSIINGEDYDIPDFPNNNNTSQNDIKMNNITSNPLRKRPRSSSIPDFSNTIDSKVVYDHKGEIKAYTDSDFGSDLEERKSTSGGIILMGNSPVYWIS